VISAVPACPARWRRRSSANLRVQGNGQGAVSAAAYLAELPSLIAEIDAGTIAVKPNAVPLSEVEEVWQRAEVRASAACSCREPSMRLP
jgi:hypothetical protein